MTLNVGIPLFSTRKLSFRGLLFVFFFFGVCTINSFSQATRIWGTYFGGNGGDYPYSVATDAAGNIYLAGMTTSTFNIASGGFQNTFNGGFDAFLVKLTPAGALLWSTYYGGTGDEKECTVTTDAAGNVYLAGWTTSTGNITSGGFQNTYGGGAYDAFLVKFDGVTGNRLWATYYGGSGEDRAGNVATDPAGNVYLCGRTESPSNIASGGFQNTYGGNMDAYLVKFDGATGNRLWATYYGGGMWDEAYNLAADATGDVYISGGTTSNSNIASGGFQNTNGGSGDAFLAKFNAATGNRIWATYYGGSGSDYGHSMALDPSGNVFMTGETTSTTSIASGGFQNTYGGGLFDDYLVKFDASGSRLWATYYGGTNNEEQYTDGLAVDASGNAYLTGDSYSPNTGNAIASGGFQNSLVGSENIFLAKFDPAGNRLCATYYGQNHEEFGLVAVDNSGNVYLAAWADFNSTTNIASGGYQNTYGGGNYDGFLIKFNSCFNVLSVTAAPTNISCFGQCTGTATATPNNGTAPYTYLWSPGGGTTSSATGLCAGTYTITVIDAAPDTATAIVTITQPAVLTASITSTAAGCGNNNGTATVTAGGGTPAYTYSWNPGGGTSSLATGLAPGNYTATVTDANGCTQTQTVTVTSGNTLSVTVSSTQAGCAVNNGTATAIPNTGTSPYTYSWNNGQTSQISTGLSAGTYTVSVIDAGGCTATETVTVTSAISSVSVTVSSTPTGCTVNNGTATANGSNGTAPYSYSWNNGQTSQTATGLAAGNYTAAVTDANGCTQTQTVSVTSNSALTLTVTSTQAGCTVNNGTATATGNNGTAPYSYSWNNGQSTQTATGLAIGNYTATVTDANGCTQTQTVSVTQTTGPSASAAAVPNSISSGDSTTLSASGGISYSWAPSAGLNNTSAANPVASPTATTTYCVYVFDANGCFDSSCVTVFIIPEPVVCGEFYIPNAFSPNGDEENEVFKAFINPVCVVEFRLTVYNRWGEKVFDTYDVNESWSGNYHGVMSNAAVYAWYCRAKFTDGKEISRKGNVSLVR
jgi:gliding motility-associated-like protein